MEERKPMYEFDLDFMGKVICSADTVSSIQGLLLLAMNETEKTNANRLLIEAYEEIYKNIFDTLKSVGYYDDIL